MRSVELLHIGLALTLVSGVYLLLVVGRCHCYQWRFVLPVDLLTWRRRSYCCPDVITAETQRNAAAAVSPRRTVNINKDMCFSDFPLVATYIYISFACSAAVEIRYCAILTSVPNKDTILNPIVFSR